MLQVNNTERLSFKLNLGDSLFFGLNNQILATEASNFAGNILIINFFEEK